MSCAPEGLSARYVRDAEVVLLGIDALPWLGHRAYGGASTVAASSWSVSTSSWGGRSDVELSVFRFAGETFDSPKELHPLNGTRYATSEAADEAAYAAGLIAYFFYVAPAPAVA